MNDKNIIICRCEDVTRADVLEYLNKGMTNIEDLKRQLRIGMGPCQGQTCQELLQREIARFLGVPIEQVKTQKTRPLAGGVKLKDIARGSKDE